MSVVDDQVDEYQRRQLEAAVEASDYLQSGFECVSTVLDYNDPPATNKAILIAAIALLSQKDIHNEEAMAAIVPILNTISEKLSDIAESLDYIAATKPDHES